MNLGGKSVVIKGEVRASEDLTVEGLVEGPVTCGDFAVTVAEGGSIVGDVIARDITVSGRSAGQLIATEVVELKATSDATGHVLAPRFILQNGATFHGRVEPQHLDAALRVAEFRHKQRGAS
jgi:cytoskeletal protein CcmA (bactofilin family)